MEVMRMETKVITGGTLIDGTGKPPVKKALLVIEGKKIAFVGQEGKRQVPTGGQVKVIDATGKTVMPGLIDSHVHIYTDGETSEFTSLPINNNHLTLALKSVPRLKRTLEMGITSLRDGGSGWGWLEVALRDAIKRGDISGPRFFATGYHLTVTGGHGYFLPSWLANLPVHPEQSTIHCDGPDAWRKAARLNIYNGTDNVKVVASRDIISPGLATAPQATLEELTAAIEEAHKMGKKAIAHAQGPAAIKNAIKAGANSIVHGFFMDEECAELMVKNNVYLESTNLYVRMIVERGKGELPDWMIPKAQETWENKKKNFKMYIEKGVKISFGSDAGVPFIKQGGNAEELSVFVELGMTPMQAIVAGTRTAAEAIGIVDQVGTLEEGKLADVILVDGDPLQNIDILHEESKIKLVMKEGEIVITR
jgi:imidazolonepropionase-like amidohydrolase